LLLPIDCPDFAKWNAPSRFTGQTALDYESILFAGNFLLSKTAKNK
jgi:hypothetical protein